MTAIQEFHFAPGNFWDNISPAQLEVQSLQVSAGLMSNVQHSIVRMPTTKHATAAKWHPKIWCQRLNCRFEGPLMYIAIDFHQHCRCYAG